MAIAISNDLVTTRIIKIKSINLSGVMVKNADINGLQTKIITLNGMLKRVV